MNNNTSILPARKSFVRIGNKAIVSNLVKEAKRVGYIVENKTCDSNVVYGYVVTDPDYSNALVLKAMNMGNCWAVTYATAYFQEPV